MGIDIENHCVILKRSAEYYKNLKDKEGLTEKGLAEKDLAEKGLTQKSLTGLEASEAGEKNRLTSLKKNGQFRSVYNNGRSAANKYLVILALKNGAVYTRIGVSVSKKIGKSVKRNRIKRQVKESCRNMQASVSAGYDIVIVARKPVSDADFNDINKSVKYLFKKLNLFSR